MEKKCTNTSRNYNQYNFEEYSKTIINISKSYGIVNTFTGVLEKVMFDSFCNKIHIDSIYTKFPTIDKLSKNQQDVCVYLWIASQIYGSQMDLSSHTQGLSPAISTTSFNMDPSGLTDAKNVFLKIIRGILGVGYKSSVSAGSIKFAKNTIKVSSEKNSMGSYQGSSWNIGNRPKY
jgi:hypothetical protein